MVVKSVAETARARWGARKNHPVGLLHLSNAINFGDESTAARLLAALSIWGRKDGIMLAGADELLDEVKAGRGAEAARRFWVEYDQAEDAPTPDMGRPPIMEGGKRRNIYLDDATAEAAKALGQGNLSEGLRRAVALASQSDATK